MGDGWMDGYALQVLLSKVSRWFQSGFKHLFGGPVNPWILEMTRTFSQWISMIWIEAPGAPGPSKSGDERLDFVGLTASSSKCYVFGFVHVSTKSFFGGMYLAQTFGALDFFKQDRHTKKETKKYNCTTDDIPAAMPVKWLNTKRQALSVFKMHCLQCYRSCGLQNPNFHLNPKLYPKKSLCKLWLCHHPITIGSRVHTCTVVKTNRLVSFLFFSRCSTNSVGSRLHTLSRFATHLLP